MAREAYRSLYGDLTKLKDDSLLDDPASGTDDDDEMFQLLLAMSEWVEGYCNRHFYPLVTTKLFDGDGSTSLLVPDLLAVTTLKEDTTDDKTYDDTWATTDYWTWPYNAQPTKHWGYAYTSLRVRGGGTKATFARAEQNFELVGQWGYQNHAELSGSLLNDAGNLDTSQTDVTYDGGGAIEVGQTVRLESEDMLVTADSSTVLTVTRAINGTTAATHADNTPISILRWPPALERAVLLNTARLWTRAPAFEPFYVDADLDTDVRLLLDPYRRIPV